MQPATAAALVFVPFAALAVGGYYYLDDYRRTMARDRDQAWREAEKLRQTSALRKKPKKSLNSTEQAFLKAADVAEKIGPAARSLAPLAALVGVDEATSIGAAIDDAVTCAERATEDVDDMLAPADLFADEVFG